MSNPESEFDGSSIYNEVYETKRAESTNTPIFKGEIYRNNETTVLLDKNEGIVKITRGSRDQLEEDIAQISGSAERDGLVLGQEKHKQLFHETCLKVISYCKGYLILKFFKIFSQA